MSPCAISMRGVVVRAPRGSRSDPSRRENLLGPIELDVSRGEHVLIVGPSGSGKTTLLRAVAGLADVAQGTIELMGNTATSGGRNVLSPEGRGVGFLFQSGALWPHMSAAKTLEFVFRERGVARADWSRRTAELLSWVELEGFESRKPGTLSGGEAQRLALARALAANPELLLLDEPLGPLDAELGDALLARLAHLHGELGLTILHVTHDPARAERIADRTLHLENGLLVNDDGGN